ncbi:SlyX family protein [Alteromonas lipotrueiana]|uniref:SlyX family protein n=1 Tax=Alteromonas lipotrueiana TaxID=2803815 RepID=UPI001C482ED2|nr:SlyX family protein [Alteromonas lipotrueiana]|tara:strand:- start:281 stop:520 length:240 start_codon:yes stop_codon:yes gene_type:complete
MNNKPQQQTSHQVLQDIEDLQTKVAFQEHTIDELNDALTHQQYQIEKLQVQLKHVLNKVKTLEPDNIAKLSEETPPPHY